MKRSGPEKRRTRKPNDPSWDEFFTEAELEAKKLKQVTDASLADTGLSVRIVNTLEDRGILTVGQLAARSRDELLAIDNFGEQTLNDCCLLIDGLGIPRQSWEKPKPKPKPKPKSKAKPKPRPSPHTTKKRKR